MKGKHKSTHNKTIIYTMFYKNSTKDNYENDLYNKSYIFRTGFCLIMKGKHKSTHNETIIYTIFREIAQKITTKKIILIVTMLIMKDKLFKIKM